VVNGRLKNVALVRLKEAAVVAWKSGVFYPLNDECDRVEDVRLVVTRELESGKCHSATFTMNLVAMVQAFIGVDGVPVAVQMFRYVGADGVPRRWLLCGECGDVMVADWLELCRVRELRCRKCSAGVSALGCVVHHSFGVCGACRRGG
jgi:hypothetical protein